MDSTRQQKVSRLLLKELADIFQKESVTMFGGALISVTIVRVAPDLSFAKVYISIFVPGGNTAAIFSLVQQHTKKIRSMLASRIAKQLRIVPELVFAIDDSLDYIEHIDNLLHSK
ncbi:MAG TPA: 30S ribosome-binding factor RbfA [Bacteroidales bacterium]|jgi:ribosome-binding factor A|nr:30S ribosome-binding factor RbfA [Bacteroidales bacterium]